MTCNDLQEVPDEMDGLLSCYAFHTLWPLLPSIADDASTAKYTRVDGGADETTKVEDAAFLSALRLYQRDSTVASNDIGFFEGLAQVAVEPEVRTGADVRECMEGLAAISEWLQAVWWDKHDFAKLLKAHEEKESKESVVTAFPSDSNEQDIPGLIPAERLGRLLIELSFTRPVQSKADEQCSVGSDSDDDCENFVI